MKFRYLLFAVAGVAMLAACETRKEPIIYAEDADAVHISATVECQHTTKTSPLGTGDELRAFNINDVITVITPDLEAPYVKGGSKWNPKDLYYFRWFKEPVAFQAYYPTVSGAGMDKFILKSNQYSLPNLVACDYMTGETEPVFREEVKIVMHRRMAKVTIRLQGIQEDQKVQAFKIGSYLKYAEGEPTGYTTVSPYVLSTDIETGADGTVYTAIVLPGPADAKNNFITLNYKGKALSLKGIPAAEQGYAYEYDLIVGTSMLTLGDCKKSSWTENYEISVTPGQGGNPDQPTPDDPTPDDPTPDNPDQPTPDDPVTPPAVEKAYFVTPEGAGDKTGSSWENAMGLEQLRPMLGVDYGSKTVENCEALDGYTFHFKEGSYCMTSNEKDRMKLAFNAYAKPCRITFLGGYDESSTGVDLTKRDINANVTKFTGDRNGNGKADSGDTGIFCLDAYAYLTFDGFTFAHSYGVATWKQKAFMLNTDVAGATTELSLNNCKFYDINEYQGTDGKYHGGSAVWLGNNCTAKLNNCEMTGLSSKSRGGALRLCYASGTMFVNNCAVYGNKVDGDWGNGVQISNGNFYANNLTVAKNTGKGAALNGGGNQLIVNTTIVNSHVSGDAGKDMALRNESSATTNTAILMNSIVLFDGDKPTIVIASGADRAMTSEGYNLYGNLCTDPSVNLGTFNTSDKDKTSVTLSSLGMTWNAAGYYMWNGTVEGFTKAKLSDVENVVKGTNLVFYNWLQEVGGGKNPLAYDQLGNARNTSAMWPGAYEKH